MIGIGIVTYNDIIPCSDEQSHDVYEVTCELIETLSMFTKDDHVIIIRDNDSLDYRYRKFNVTLNSNRFKHINTLFIPSKVNELTDAWNEILTIGFDNYNCEAMVLLNNDVIVTKYWQNYINAIKVQSNDILGSITNDAPYQPLQVIEENDFVENPELVSVAVIQGFCMGGSRKAFKENMYDDTHYFDPKIEWGFNEEEWIVRNRRKGGRSLIVQNSYVIHINAATWLKNARISSKVPEQRITRKDKLVIYDTLSYNDYIENKCSV